MFFFRGWAMFGYAPMPLGLLWLSLPCAFAAALALSELTANLKAVERVE